uniref:Guanine nucleotide exchange factor VAV2 n=1 Tax=Heterorhabditis bacteriophora TaxID=37862 RepID=A0A1I7X974_HETBA
MSERCELWRECVRWLRDVGVLNFHGLDLSNTLMVDFANMLRDGVLLCRLINELEPYCIDEKAIQLRPHMSEVCKYYFLSRGAIIHSYYLIFFLQFTCHKSVTAFLGACQSHFHFKEEDLFEASDLIRLRDFGKVLSTLSMLSYSDSAMRKGIKPFPLRVRPTVPTRICPPPEEEAIYKSLLDDVETVDLDSAVYDVRPYVRNDEEPQLIYDRIVCRKDSQRKHDVWSTFSPQSKREHCIKELLDTEQNYVEKALNMIINKFYEPLQKFIEEHDHKTIFMNITALWNLHHSFYSDLRQAVLKSVGLNQVSDGRPSSLGRTIGDVFLLHKEKFIAYGPYCMGLDESRMKILDLEKNDMIIRAKIAECTSSVNDNQFKLQDLLCLPMQRVLKYHILLSEMIKSTSVDAPDRKSLESAKEAMDDVNSYINEMKRDNETRQLIMEIQNSITDLSMPGNVTLMEYGRLNADGEVRLSESTASQSGKMKQRHVFLFDKVLIICRANRVSLHSYKKHSFIVPLIYTYIFRKLASGQHLLYLLVRENRSCSPDSARQITLSFKSSPQREKWLHQFESARNNIVPNQIENTGHKLRYESFSIDEPHKCSVCCKFLKGLFYQGYSCDHCRNLLHKSCIVLRPCSGSRHSSAISYSGSFNSRSQLRHSALGGCMFNWIYCLGNNLFRTLIYMYIIVILLRMSIYSSKMSSVRTKEDLENAFISSGEKERIKEVLLARLRKDGWVNEVKNMARRAIKEKMSIPEVERRFKVEIESVEGIPDLKIIKPKVFPDDRGFFSETYNAIEWEEALNYKQDFKQDNHSFSKYGVLRGLHTQPGMGKLVSVISGEIFDVAVDIRPGSATYGKWHGVLLNGKNKHAFWIPDGFLHGFQCLSSEGAHVTYKCTGVYDAKTEYECPFDYLAFKESILSIRILM